MSTSPSNHQIKNEPIDRQTESNKDEKIKQLEQMQENLFDRIRIKSNEYELLKQNETNLIATNTELYNTIEINSNNHMDLSNEITSLKAKLLEAKETIEIIRNENEILKQNETNLIAKNDDLNSIIEMNTNNQMNLSNEITSLKEKLFEANEIIETKTNEINDLKIQIENSNTASNIDFNNQIILQDENVAKQLKQMQKMLMETVQIRTNEIEILKQRNKTFNDEEFTYALNESVTPTASQSIELPQQSEEYINFALNLEKLKLLVDNLKNFESQSIQELNEHCQEQKCLVQLAAELKIETLENKSKKRKFDKTNDKEENIDQINRSNKELIEVINDYEQTCINEFLHKTSTIKVSFSQLVDEANTFLDIKQAYLNREQTNDGEIQIFNLESIELQSKLNKELKKAKYLIFNNKKIVFINEITADESIVTPLGYFDYDECFKVSLFYYI